MNKHAIQLLQDLAEAGLNTNVPLVPLRPASRPIRSGKVATTDETVKMEIAGLPCQVKSETDGLIRVYVTRENGKTDGPFTLLAEDVI